MCELFVEHKELARKELQKYKTINFSLMTSGNGTPSERVIIAD